MERKKKRIMLASAGVALLASCSALLMQGNVSLVPNVLKVQAKEKSNYENYKYSQVQTYENDTVDFSVGNTNQEQKVRSEITTRKGAGEYNAKSILDIIIKIPQVEILSVKNVKPNSAMIKWKKISGVTGYEIYRAKGADGKYKKIKNISQANTVAFKDTKLSKKSSYYYKIRAYKQVNGKKIRGEFSDYSYVYIVK